MFPCAYCKASIDAEALRQANVDPVKEVTSTVRLVVLVVGGLMALSIVGGIFSSCMHCVAVNRATATAEKAREDAQKAHEKAMKTAEIQRCKAMCSRQCPSDKASQAKRPACIQECEARCDAK